MKDIFEKWDLDCTEVGVVTDTGKLEVYHEESLIASIPTEDLVLGGGAPQYDMPASIPEYINTINSFKIDNYEEIVDYNNSLLSLLSDPNIASKSYVYNQYDSTVRTNTALGPGSDAAVVRIKDTTKALAISTDCNRRYVYINPKQGAMMAVAEAARNVVCTGAKPLAITNCLNFGNPQDPEIYWQFKEAVLGMGDMCRLLDTPVTGGNVSFYNETITSAVYPTPVIGMVGFLDNVENMMTMNFKDSGDLIAVIGNLSPSLGGSSYLKKMYNKIEGPLAVFNEGSEIDLQNLCLDLIEKKVIKSAHDVSDGGLSVAVAKSICSSENNIGAKLFIDHKLRADELLFGECPSLIVVTLKEEELFQLVLLAKKYNVQSQTIGKVTDDGLFEINDLLKLTKKELQATYNNSFKEKMETVE